MIHNYKKTQEVFNSKYTDVSSDWGGHSGAGSLPFYTIPYRLFLEQFIFLNKVRSVVDVGCGDWQFSKFINFSPLKYTGYDIAPNVINKNKKMHSSENISFFNMPQDLSDVKSADLLIMKDVLQHLPNTMIWDFINNLFPKFKFCLITNSFKKHSSPTQNTDIPPGGFRCLDLKASPFNINGTYVLEFTSPLYEFIRVLLLNNNS